MYICSKINFCLHQIWKILKFWKHFWNAHEFLATSMGLNRMRPTNTVLSHFLWTTHIWAAIDVGQEIMPHWRWEYVNTKYEKSEGNISLAAHTNFTGLAVCRLLTVLKVFRILPFIFAALTATAAVTSTAAATSVASTIAELNSLHLERIFCGRCRWCSSLLHFWTFFVAQITANTPSSSWSSPSSVSSSLRGSHHYRVAL